MSERSRPLLSVRGLTKRFPSSGVLANDRVDFSLNAGEVHALLGENGAGKSTLMNVLYGLVRHDHGEMVLRGRPFRPRSPSGAIAAGIGMVHQHFMLVPTLSVTENVVLGREPLRGALIDRREATARVMRLSDEHGLDVPPEALVEDLSVGVQQRVEILKALYRRAELLILDEPTAVLSPPEADQLFAVMRRLAAKGRSIIFITHKLREVLAASDRITVLRDGRVVGTTTPADSTAASLAAMMVGRPVLLSVDKAPPCPGAPILEVRGLRARDDRGVVAIDGVDLMVRAGEILGVAGVEGNGQSELVEVLTGLRPAEAGTVHLAGQDAAQARLGRRARAAVAHIPEDRHKYGLVLAYPIADNLILSRYDEPPFARGFRMALREVRSFARGLMRDYDVRARSVEALAASLSGGNQQKVVVARELIGLRSLLIAAQPTRGIDVGSTESIHRKILQARDGGAAVLLVSAELDEVLALSDRVAVLSRGRVVAVLDAAEARADRGRLGLLMGGATDGGDAG